MPIRVGPDGPGRTPSRTPPRQAWGPLSTEPTEEADATHDMLAYADPVEAFDRADARPEGDEWDDMAARGELVVRVLSKGRGHERNQRGRAGLQHTWDLMEQRPLPYTQLHGHNSKLYDRRDWQGCAGLVCRPAAEDFVVGASHNWHSDDIARLARRDDYPTDPKELGPYLVKHLSKDESRPKLKQSPQKLRTKLAEIAWRKALAGCPHNIRYFFDDHTKYVLAAMAKAVAGTDMDFERYHDLPLHESRRRFKKLWREMNRGELEIHSRLGATIRLNGELERIYDAAGEPIAESAFKTIWRSLKKQLEKDRQRTEQNDEPVHLEAYLRRAEETRDKRVERYSNRVAPNEQLYFMPRQNIQGILVKLDPKSIEQVREWQPFLEEELGREVPLLVYLNGKLQELPPKSFEALEQCMQLDSKLSHREGKRAVDAILETFGLAAVDVLLERITKLDDKALCAHLVDQLDRQHPDFWTDARWQQLAAAAINAGADRLVAWIPRKTIRSIARRIRLDATMASLGDDLKTLSHDALQRRGRTLQKLIKSGAALPERYRRTIDVDAIEDPVTLLKVFAAEDKIIKAGQVKQPEFTRFRTALAKTVGLVFAGLASLAAAGGAVWGYIKLVAIGVSLLITGPVGAVGAAAVLLLAGLAVVCFAAIEQVWDNPFKWQHDLHNIWNDPEVCRIVTGEGPPSDRDRDRYLSDVNRYLNSLPSEIPPPEDTSSSWS